MKKQIFVILFILLIMSVCSACHSNDEKTTDPSFSSGDKLKIVTTIFPEYDWVREIVGKESDNIELTLLLDQGVDLHSYQPSVDDIIKISTCDLFVYVGGESDAWVKKALADAANQNMAVINLLDTLGAAAKEEALIEGMEAEEPEEENTEADYDEHVWLSLKNAKLFCSEIAEKLGEADQKHKESYLANAEYYIRQLDTLDMAYQKTVAESSIKTLLFGDRFPFRYFVDDYGLSYYAAFAGCSAETEASFETVVFLANKIDALHLKAILQLESADGKIASTIRQNTLAKNQKILTMDSMQSITAADIQNGVTYLSIMEQNLRILKEALE